MIGFDNYYDNYYFTIRLYSINCPCGFAGICYIYRGDLESMKVDTFYKH